MIRFFDILFSGIAIVILLPFMIPIMIGLKLTGEHDIFYRQIRVGKGGRDFGLFKFATMLRNSPNLSGGLYTSKDDPRMLPMGNFLRKTKINELPQLLNIFIGQMSVIGYRPTVRQHYEAYSEKCRIKLADSTPGLSGIGSIVFRNEEEILQQFEDKKSFHQNVINPYKAELEAWYIGHKGLYNYFKLIFLTLDAVLHSSSKKWQTSFNDIPPIPNELKPYI
ncbi:MAG: sugar transferase [Lachnoclostridium sp.]|jgi:lipopolysaccharide/colanic/teichoic acid biosynthesis glycosyltransferase|nr:sugar transferase [Lachnoclostridium sp.]